MNLSRQTSDFVQKSIQFSSLGGLLTQNKQALKDLLSQSIDILSQANR